jgi:hypothetical protein
MLHTHWSAEAWPQVRAGFKKALALRSEIRGAGWSVTNHRGRLLVMRGAALVHVVLFG